MKPLTNILEAIQKLQPELQKLFKPIYDLTRKGRPFNWGKEQQDSFDEIKCRLIKPPMLHMPKNGKIPFIFRY